MSDYNTTPHELGWDDEITSDSGQFILLEEGDYDFTVTAFERGRFPGSKKTPPCKKAIFTLSVDTPAGTASVKYDLILYSTLKWKIALFLRAIGQMSPEQTTIQPRWNEIVGSRGRARFKVRTYEKKDGSEGRANDVERFYDFDPGAAQSGTAQQTWVDLPKTTATPWDSGVF